MRCKMPWWGGQRNSSLKTAFKHLYKLLKESIMALHQRTGSTKKLPFSSICQAWQAHWSIRPGMSFQAIAKQNSFVVDTNVAIVFSTNEYKQMMASQLWACVHQWSWRLQLRFKMDTPVVQQQINCLINNSEHNEVKLNVSDTDADLSFIKKWETREGRKKRWTLPRLHGPVSIISCILRF